MEDNLQPSPEQAQAPVQGQPESEPSVPDFSGILNDPAKLDALVGSLPDEVINKVPAFNKRMDNFVNKKQKELEKQQREQEAQRQAQEQKRQQDRFVAQQFVNQVESMSAADRGNLFMQQPELALKYKQSKDFVNNAGQASENLVAERIWTNARKALESKYEVDLAGANTLEEAMEAINESTVGAKVKEVEKAFEAKLAALRTELTGQVAKSGSQPDRNASHGAGNTKRTYTAAEIEKMSLSEYRALASDIDLAVKEGRMK